MRREQPSFGGLISIRDAVFKYDLGAIVDGLKGALADLKESFEVFADGEDDRVRTADEIYRNWFGTNVSGRP